MNKINIAIPLYKKKRLNELIGLINKLSNYKNLKIYVYIDLDVYTEEPIVNKINSNAKIIYTKFGKKIGRHISDEKRINIFDKILNKIYSYIKNLSIAKIYLEIKFLLKLKIKYWKILPIFKSYQIDIVMLLGDRHTDHIEPVLIKIAKEVEAKIVITYLAYYTEKDYLVNKSKYAKNNERGLSIYDQIMQNRFSSMSVNNKFYYPHWKRNALRKFGTLSNNPWVMGAGKANILCLPDKKMLIRYKDNYNIKEEKLKVVGDISYDTLYEAYKNRKNVYKTILEKYDLNKGIKTLIIALPQLAEHNILPWKRHWEEINFLVSVITSCNLNILLSLHPKMSREKYNFLENKYKCNILDERLVEVLPIADFFVASNSSTVMWAIQCGIKSLVVDFYGLNIDIFNNLQTVEIVKEKKELKQKLNSLEYKVVDFHKDWSLLSRDNVFQGQVIENYVKLFEEIINKKS